MAGTTSICYVCHPPVQQGSVYGLCQHQQKVHKDVITLSLSGAICKRRLAFGTCVSIPLTPSAVRIIRQDGYFHCGGCSCRRKSMYALRCHLLTEKTPCDFAITWRTRPLPPTWSLVSPSLVSVGSPPISQSSVRRAASSQSGTSDGPLQPKRIRLTLSGRAIRTPTRYEGDHAPVGEPLSATNANANQRDELSIEGEFLSNLAGLIDVASEAAALDSTANVAASAGGDVVDMEDLLIVASRDSSPEPPPSTTRSDSTPTTRAVDHVTKGAPEGAKRRARRPAGLAPLQKAPAGTTLLAKSVTPARRPRSPGGSFVRAPAPLRPSGSRPSGAVPEEVVDARLRDRFMAALQRVPELERTGRTSVSESDAGPPPMISRGAPTPLAAVVSTAVEEQSATPAVEQQTSASRSPRLPAPVQSLLPTVTSPRSPLSRPSCPQPEQVIAAPPSVTSLKRSLALAENGTSTWSEADLPSQCCLTASADLAVRNAHRHAFKAVKVAELGNALCRVRRYRWSASSLTLDWVRDDRQGTWTRAYPPEIVQAGTVDDCVRFLEAEEAAVEAKGWSIISGGELDDRSGISISWERLPQLSPPMRTRTLAPDAAASHSPAPVFAAGPSTQLVSLPAIAFPPAPLHARPSAAPLSQLEPDDGRRAIVGPDTGAASDLSSTSDSARAADRPSIAEAARASLPAPTPLTPAVPPTVTVAAGAAAPTSTPSVKFESREMELYDVLLDPLLFEIDPGLFLDADLSNGSLAPTPATSTSSVPEVHAAPVAALAPPPIAAARHPVPVKPALAPPFPLRTGYDDVLEQMINLLEPLESAFADSNDCSIAESRDTIERAISATEALRESLALQIAGPLRRQRRLAGVNAYGSHSG